MKVKLQTYLSRSIADIIIKTNCAEQVVSKLIDVLEIENAFIRVMGDYGDISGELERIKAKYKLTIQSDKSGDYLQLTAASDKCKMFLNDIPTFSPETISVIGIKNEHL